VRNLLVREQFPDGQATAGGTDVRTSTYDAARRLVTRRDQGGVTTTYAYDKAGRMTGRTYSAGSAGDLFSYDAVGRLVRAESGQHGNAVDFAWCDTATVIRKHLTQNDLTLLLRPAVGPHGHLS
jgi:YD repeat-containing protein